MTFFPVILLLLAALGGPGAGLSGSTGSMTGTGPSLLSPTPQPPAAGGGNPCWVWAFSAADSGCSR